MTNHKRFPLASAAGLVFCAMFVLPDTSGQQLPLAPGRIVAHVDLVQVSVIVFDQKGRVAADLKKTDFRLFDDDVEQPIINFERERVPVSFVILADRSSSMTRKIPFVQEAALSILDAEPKNPSVDEYSVVSIAKRSTMLVSFTRDEQDLERRLPLLLTTTNESTALFDGICRGVRTAQLEAANRQKAMIIITDGGDNHSRYKLRDTRKMLEEADVPVFAVMAGPTFELPEIFAPRQRKQARFPGRMNGTARFPFPVAVGDDFIGPAERRGPGNMKALTEATGGGVFTAGHEEDLARIVRTIGLAVRYRYTLTYKPVRGETKSTKSAERVDQRHKIHLELSPQDKFKGYSMPYYKRSYRSAGLY